MADATHLFRKAPTARLSSPEQLDVLMQVTSPRAWLSLLAFGFLLAAAIGWGIFGNVPTKVAGQGILLKSGGIVEVTAAGSGQIAALYVKVGDQVEKGRLLARVAQTELAEQVRAQKVKIDEERRRHEQLARFGTEDMRLKGEYAARQRENIKQTIETAKRRLGWLEEKIANQTGLLAEGLITKETLVGTKQQHDATQAEIESGQNQLKKLDVEELELKNQKGEALLESELKLSELERSVALLETNLDLASTVVSPHNGRAVEIRVVEGGQVSPGTPVLNLELAGGEGRGLEALLYVPATEGKKLSSAMGVQISPSTVQQEEYGFLLGRVTEVAEFPSTFLGMMRNLGNKELVENFQKATGGAPIEVRAALLADPGTASGYRWSSPHGPPIRIQAGTVCAAAITVRAQRPITLVVPALKKFFGV